MTKDNFKGGITHGELPITIEGNKIYDVSSLYPVPMSQKGIGKTHQVDRKYKTEINNKHEKLTTETGEALKRTFPITMESERQKILDEVLKMLEKEVELVLNKKVGQFYLGLQHAILLVKDMKK